MIIDFSKLNYKFIKKPLLIGGKAMEYYDLRKSGQDIDFVVCKKDIKNLALKYPQHLKDLCGDFGVAIYEFEIWKTINYFDYDDLIDDAIEEDNFYVISIDKLLRQKAMAMDKAKYFNDLKLIVKKIQSQQGEKYKEIQDENKNITNLLTNINYVEKREIIL